MIVYLITNRHNGKRYVGITSRTLETRWHQHCLEANSVSQLPLHRAIRKYGREAFEVEILDTAENWESLCERERHWIREFDTCHGRGYNATEGGDGVKGYVLTEEQRRALSERQMGEKNHNFGKIWAPNKGEDNPMFGKKHSDEAKKKIGEATSLNKRKHVDCFSKKGDFVATYHSLTEAAKAVSGQMNKISECLCGHRKTHKGYVWKYHIENSERH